MSKPIYAEAIKTYNQFYEEDHIVIITSKLSVHPYDNAKFWLLKPGTYMASNAGYKRIDL